MALKIHMVCLDLCGEQMMRTKYGKYDLYLNLGFKQEISALVLKIIYGIDVM